MLKNRGNNGVSQNRGLDTNKLQRCPFGFPQTDQNGGPQKHTRTEMDSATQVDPVATVDGSVYERSYIERRLLRCSGVAISPSSGLNGTFFSLDT